MAGMATPFAAISSKNFLLSKWLGTATLTKVVSRMQLKCVICAQKHRIGDCPKLDEADGKEKKRKPLRGVGGRCFSLGDRK